MAQARATRHKNRRRQFLGFIFLFYPIAFFLSRPPNIARTAHARRGPVQSTALVVMPTHSWCNVGLETGVIAEKTKVRLGIYLWLLPEGAMRLSPGSGRWHQHAL